MHQAVEVAKTVWGERALPDLEAEDRLSVACEKAPTSDFVIFKLRAAFQARCQARWQLLRTCGRCWDKHCLDAVPCYKCLFLRVRAGKRLIA